MRDLSFLLHLHAFSPLARFSRTSLKPYLPLEVRYLVRSSGEVFLYLSNNPNNKTWGDDLSLFTTERIDTLIPVTGAIAPLPGYSKNTYSYLTNEFAFIGMLCRRRLACHYLPTHQVSQPYTPSPAEIEFFIKTEETKSGTELCFLLFAVILAILGFFFLVSQRVQFYEQFN